MDLRTALLCMATADESETTKCAINGVEIRTIQAVLCIVTSPYVKPKTRFRVWKTVFRVWKMPGFPQFLGSGKPRLETLLNTTSIIIYLI